MLCQTGRRRGTRAFEVEMITAAKKRWIVAAVPAGTLAWVVGAEMRAHPTPLSVGATADEARTYIHNPAANASRGPLFYI